MLDSFRSIALALLSLSLNCILAASSPRLVYQFPQGAEIENIAARSNGHLLLGLISAPELYTLDPTAASPSPNLLYTFPNATSLTGIAETTTPDIFAVIAGSYHINNFTGIPGSFSIWRVDLRSNPPAVSMMAPVPDAGALNGLAVIQDTSGTLLAADSALGAIFAVNPSTRKVNMAIKDAMFAPTATFPLGINGIKTRNGVSGAILHFTNSAQGLYGTMPVRSDGSSAGSAKQLATLAASEQYDDFAVDRQGNAFITAHPNVLYQVSLDGIQTLFSNSSSIHQPTSATFGRGSGVEMSTLYLSTDGEAPGGGQVITLDNATPMVAATLH